MGEVVNLREVTPESWDLDKLRHDLVSIRNFIEQNKVMIEAFEDEYRHLNNVYQQLTSRIN